LSLVGYPDDNIGNNYDLRKVLHSNPDLEVIITVNLGGSLVYYRNEHPDWVKVVVDTALKPPLACAIADIDKAAGPDIVLCESGAHRVVVYTNNGAGNFVRGSLALDVKSPGEVEAADFNSDGNMDLVVVSRDTSNSAVLFLSNGNGGFNRTILATGQSASDVEVGDWDGNSTVDVLVSFDRALGLSNYRDIVLFKNNGSGVFSDSDLHHVWERTQTLKLADLDNDQDLDLILGGNSITVNDGFQALVNDGGNVASVVQLSTVAVDIFGVDAADIDGDGHVEIFGTDRERRSLFVLRGGITADVLPSNTGPMPLRYALLQNYPNPFNPSTTIRYGLPYRSHVSLAVFNTLGQQVAVLQNGEQEGGYHEVKFEGLVLLK